jgi:PIN domain nuclease of toxin-antitoxin system
MKLLFDTHAFLWWDSAPSKLSPRMRAICHDRANVLLVSVVSAWEMQIKSQLGKLELDAPLDELFQRQQEVNGVDVLPVELDHVLALQHLPPHHRDPFDRLLITQAIIENATLITNDGVIAKYPVERLF